MVTKNSLSYSLLKAWDEFEKQIRLSQNKLSVKNVHQLRISTQQLEAALRLVKSLELGECVNKSILFVHEVRKHFGPLRDYQVECKNLKQLIMINAKYNMKIEFHRFLNALKKNARRNASDSLNKLSLNHERKRIVKLTNMLIRLEESKGRQYIQSVLAKHFKSSFDKLEGIMSNINPLRVQRIHKLRIRAKKVRYQAEILNVMADSDKYDLSDLKHVQEITGKIQNESVLISTIDQFLAKKNYSDDAKAINVRKKIVENQLEVINNDFKDLSALQLKKIINGN